MHNVDIFYIVCGEDRHYLNLQKSVKSLSRINSVNKRIHIFDMSNKLDSFSIDCDFKKYSLPDVEKKDFYHHKIWKAKYQACKFLPEEDNYRLYIDTDCVIVNDTISNLCDKIQNSFGVTKHFWVPTFYRFVNSVSKDHVLIKNSLEKLNIVSDFDFVAGGIFLFKNNKSNSSIINRILDLYEVFYDNESKYVNFITDETFLSKAISESNNAYFLNGAFNHCSMINMPLQLHDGVIYGRNPFDPVFEKVTAFHCDTFRRDPSIGYDSHLSELIKKAFYV